MNAKYLNPTVCLIKYVAAIIAFDGLLRPSKMLVILNLGTALPKVDVV